MKLPQRILITVLVVGMVLLAGQPAQAHVLERDGSISAVLHMPPDDAPAALRPVIVNLAFASERGVFVAGNYRIELAVKREGRTLQTVAMAPLDGSDTNLSATVSLPEPGSYRLVATGRPRTAADQIFSLSFDIRAGGSGSASVSRNPGFDFWIISGGSWLLLLLVAAHNIRQGGRYR